MYFFFSDPIFNWLLGEHVEAPPDDIMNLPLKVTVHPCSPDIVLVAAGNDPSGE